jgi:hypothetical protein
MKTTHASVILAVAISLGFILAGASSSAASPSEKLKEDLVSVRDGKFVYEDLRLCQIKDPTGADRPTGPKFQLRSYSEAANTGFISRDVFLMHTLFVKMYFVVGLANRMLSLTPSQAIQALDCEPLSSPIGSPDFEIITHFTPEGYQAEFVDKASGKRTHSTETWK